MSAPSSPVPTGVAGVVRRRRARGFTMVELLVATTAGLFVAVAAFALAKQSSQFFQGESRVATAQFADTLGFERLRNDIARAGFQSSPNVRMDPKLCDRSLPAGGWTTYAGLTRLAALRIYQGTSGAPPPGLTSTDALYQAAPYWPDGIDLAGSFSSLEQFPVAQVQQSTSGGYDITLQKGGAYYRTTTTPYSDATTGGGLTDAFAGISGRMVRFADLTGKTSYGLVSGTSTDATGRFVVTVATAPAITTGTSCGVVGKGTGSGLNVVNWIRYSIRPPSGVASQYAPLYDAGVYGADTLKHDLIRVELDPTTMTEVASTMEIIAENAVDMKFGLTYVSSYGAGTAPEPTTASAAPGDIVVGQVAGDITAATGTCAAGSTVARPQCIRSIRARLGVRSREFDRTAPVNFGGGDAGTGMVRISSPDGGTFARVRNMVADIHLTNLVNVTW